jgi:predicted NBD/HSP70 family sugar kinase
VNLPTALFNDANCFTAGEWWKGAGQGTRTFCGVTLGTGIGMGLILNGHGHPGAHGNAGEIWKSPLKEADRFPSHSSSSGNRLPRHCERIR